MSRDRLKAAGRARRKRKHRIQFAVFLSLIIMMTLVLLYMFTSVSYVRTVTIDGNQLVSDKKVRELMNIDDTTRIYTLKVSDMEQNIKMQDGVKDVIIKRHFPNRLTVDIKEYAVRAIVADGSRYHPVLENGQILKREAKISGPVLSGFEGNDLVRMIDVLNGTDAAVRNNMSEINFLPNKEASSRVQLFMNDGLEVIGDLRTLGDKLDYYPGMANDVPRDADGALIKPGIIDLEVGAVFIPYESKKAEEKRLELESEIKAKKEREAKQHEQALKKKLEQSRKKTE